MVHPILVYVPNKENQLQFNNEDWLSTNRNENANFRRDGKIGSMVKRSGELTAVMYLSISRLSTGRVMRRTKFYRNTKEDI